MDNYNKDLCILSKTDKIIATEKALKAHQKPILHRAFSIFIFTNNKLLLQKRADKKLVFPGYITNSCCSHPFLNTLSFLDPVLDCKIHAVERVRYELGIEICIDDLIFFDRFLYFAGSDFYFGKSLGCEVNSQDVILLNVPDDVNKTNDNYERDNGYDKIIEDFTGDNDVVFGNELMNSVYSDKVINCKDKFYCNKNVCIGSKQNKVKNVDLKSDIEKIDVKSVELKNDGQVSYVNNECDRYTNYYNENNQVLFKEAETLKKIVKIQTENQKLIDNLEFTKNSDINDKTNVNDDFHVETINSLKSTSSDKNNDDIIASLEPSFNINCFNKNLETINNLKIDANENCSIINSLDTHETNNHLYSGSNEIFQNQINDEISDIVNSDKKNEHQNQTSGSKIFNDKTFKSNFVEYEIDYCFFCVTNKVPNFNTNEVSEILYVDENEFRSICKAENVSPWMKMISEKNDIFKLIRK